MRLVTFNIQYGLGRDGILNPSRQAELIRDADIIALQEVERFWKRSGNVDQVALFQECLPERYACYAAGIDVDASVSQSGRVLNRRRQFGNLTLSRWPILSSRTLVLPKIDVAPAFNGVTVALETVIDCPGGPVKIFNTHLSHVGAEERLLQLQGLKTVIDRQAIEGPNWSGGDPVDASWTNDEAPPPNPADFLLMGDFNAEPVSTEYGFITGAAGLGLLDCHAVAPNRDKGGITYFKDLAQDAPHDQRIDHIFASPSLAGRVVRLEIDEKTRLSDHQPVWLTLSD